MMTEQHSGYALRDILHVLFKRKWLILTFFLVTTATGSLLAVMVHQTLYDATAQILISPGREHITDLAMSPATPVPARVSFDLDEQSARTIEMLTGRYLAEQLVQTLGARAICREPTRWQAMLLNQPFCDPNLSDELIFDRVVGQVQNNVHAQRVGNAALLNVGFLHSDPAIAAKVVNTLGALYLDRHLGVLKNPGTDAFLQEQAEVLKQRLAQADSALETFKQQNGIGGSIKEERDAALQQLVLLESQQSELLNRRADVYSRLAKRTGRQSSAGVGSEASTVLRDKLLELERKESQLAVRLGDNNPELIGIRQEIKQAREAAEQERTQHFQGELGAVQARELAQVPKLSEIKRKLQALDGLEPEFNRLSQRAQAEQQNYRMYLAKTEESRVRNAMDAEKIASVRVIDAARPPVQPLNSKVRLTMLLAAVFGLIGGLVIAFALELFGDHLETAERAESILGVPVLTSIPTLRGR